MKWLMLLVFVMIACDEKPPTAPAEEDPNPLYSLGCLQRTYDTVLPLQNGAVRLDLKGQWRVVTQDSIVYTIVALNAIPTVAGGDTVYLEEARYRPLEIDKDWTYRMQTRRSERWDIGSQTLVVSRGGMPTDVKIFKDLDDPQAYWMWFETDARAAEYRSCQ